MSTSVYSYSLVPLVFILSAIPGCTDLQYFRDTGKNGHGLETFRLCETVGSKGTTQVGTESVSCTCQPLPKDHEGLSKEEKAKTHRVWTRDDNPTLPCFPHHNDEEKKPTPQSVLPELRPLVALLMDAATMNKIPPSEPWQKEFYGRNSRGPDQTYVTTHVRRV